MAFPRKHQRPTRERMVEWRDAGWSQADVARELGVPVQTVVYWTGVHEIHWPDPRTVYIEHDGRRMTLASASRRYGIPYPTLYWRYEHGWPIEALLRPVSDGRHRRNPPRDYRVALPWGVTWGDVLDELDRVRAEGVREKTARMRIARRYRIPLGAIGCAERGEWHHLKTRYTRS